MKLSAASLIFFLSVGGAAASEDMLLRGSGSEKSDSSRQLKSVNAQGNGKPDITWRCKDYILVTDATCEGFAAGKNKGDTCQQCCECECDCVGATVVEAEVECMKLQEEDAPTEVSCAAQGAAEYSENCDTCDAYCDVHCATSSPTTTPV